MGSSGVAALFAFVAGLGGALQIAVQGRLADRIGSVEALACASVLGGLAALVVLVAARRSFDGLVQGVAGPKWLLLGGVMSALIILSITIAGPRIGVVATTAVLIAAQFGFASVIDRFGLFGVEQIPLTWTRVAGVALLLGGAALTLRR
jgi:bacterial/archaeal transporter family-2 protein